MSRRTMETAVERLERRQMPCRQRYIVWFNGRPWGKLPDERDDAVQYVHHFAGRRPSAAEWARLWLSIPAKNRQSTGAGHSLRTREDALCGAR